MQIRPALVAVATAMLVLGIAFELRPSTRPAEHVRPAAPVSHDGGQEQAPGPAAEKPKERPSLVESKLTTFIETFDGDPARPEPFASTRWDVAVDIRGRLEDVGRFPAEHGHDCSPPDNTHAVDSREGMVFICRDHLMTVVGPAEYGLIYLTPDHMVDFGGGEAVIRFDMSTRVTSKRDWVDIWITPYEQNLAFPLERWLPDLQGEPANAVQVRMTPTNVGTVFNGTITRDFAQQKLSAQGGKGLENLLEPSARERTTFELRISRTHIRFGLPDLDHWWIDEAIEDLGWERGVVQFGHHSYNPEKDGGGRPNTWHWDNVSIEPALPFTIIGAHQRVIEGETSTATFPIAAPPDTHLRFGAIGLVELSMDGGRTWEPAQRAEAYRDGTRAEVKEEHIASYWHPVPEGTEEVSFRFSRHNWYDLHKGALEISFWSLSVLDPTGR
jgi:hypothetical protein